jgi:sulfite exporter TauE/SafE
VEAPLAARASRSERTAAALAVGALWGLMPCGLVYAAFGLALAAGTPVRGALVIAAFGPGFASRSLSSRGP